MNKAKFILSKKKLSKQINLLKKEKLKICYSYKTNNQVGQILQEISDCDFSIHSKKEIDMIKDKSRIWFFSQAESIKELKNILEKGIEKFVIDNEIDLERILKASEQTNKKINLSLRMKFGEHRIGSGKYFVYGMFAKKINEIISKINEKFINKLGIHIHRKSQNTSEWEIKTELKDSLSEEALRKIDFVNLGGGLPVKYRSYTSKILPYIFSKIKKTREWLEKFDIETYIEPGRFIAAPCIKLETEIIQKQNNVLVINTTIYNCALDNILTGNKMLIEQELDDDSEGEYFLIKGNSPTKDDIFRYKVKLKNPKVGDKIVFLNAGAYNYTTDFFGYKKLETDIKKDAN